MFPTKSLNNNVRVRCPIIAKKKLGCESSLIFPPFLQETCFFRGVFTKAPSRLCLGVCFVFVLPSSEGCLF